MKINTFPLVALAFLSCYILSSCNGVSENREDKIKIKENTYSCLPCGQSCDTLKYTKAGKCTHCMMELVQASSIVHKNIQPGQMCSLDVSQTVFLDVRTAAEFNGSAPEKFGAIKNAINIPVQELESRLQELEAFKEKDIVVYCSHSHRSPMASYMLTQNGFKNVTNMNAGMSEWNTLVRNPDCNEKLYRQQ